LSAAPGADQRATQFARATSMNDQANMSLTADQANAQQMANAQARRSEASTSGLNNQAQISQDMNARTSQQVDLAAQVQSANIGYAAGISSANIRRMMNILRNNA
jgi:hypothetical protein